jgi:uncharacterized RDD family membrane protein YckC
MSDDQTAPPVILGRYAGFFTRLAAFVIDRAIIAAITSGVMWVFQVILDFFRVDTWLDSTNTELQIRGLVIALGGTVAIYLLVHVLYDIGFWLLAGQTPGKRVLGLRVVRTDGTRLRFGNALRREIGYLVSYILYLGFLWILFDNRRQGWHDKIAGTIVVYSWPEKRLKGTFVIDRVQRIRMRQAAKD